MQGQRRSPGNRFEAQHEKGEIMEEIVTPGHYTRDSSIGACMVWTPGNEGSFPEDDMIAWLQYPLEDSIDRSYCDLFSDQAPISDAQNMRDSITGSAASVSPSANICDSGFKLGSVDVELALDAERAGGKTPQHKPSPSALCSHPRPIIPGIRGLCSLRPKPIPGHPGLGAGRGSAYPGQQYLWKPARNSTASGVEFSSSTVVSVLDAGKSSECPSVSDCPLPCFSQGLDLGKKPISTRTGVGISMMVETSSSGGSLSSPAKSGKDIESSKKRMCNDAEELECQSEAFQEDFADIYKRPSPRESSSKRSRAAQVHNLSEKRRRNRINEKMKALQNLIPNSNKTDKASMLDEAIDYLKQLQLQVQILSMRSGMNLSPMYMPTRFPYMQMQQIPQMCMSMGMGPNMGIGMGLMDMSLGIPGRPLENLHNLHPMAMPNMSVTASNIDNCTQVSSAVDSSQLQVCPSTPQELYSASYLQRQ